MEGLVLRALAQAGSEAEVFAALAKLDAPAFERGGRDGVISREHLPTGAASAAYQAALARIRSREGLLRLTRDAIAVSPYDGPIPIGPFKDALLALDPPLRIDDWLALARHADAARDHRAVGMAIEGATAAARTADDARRVVDEAAALVSWGTTSGGRRSEAYAAAIAHAIGFARNEAQVFALIAKLHAPRNSDAAGFAAWRELHDAQLVVYRAAVPKVEAIPALLRLEQAAMDQDAVALVHAAIRESLGQAAADVARRSQLPPEPLPVTEDARAYRNLATKLVGYVMISAAALARAQAARDPLRERVAADQLARDREQLRRLEAQVGDRLAERWRQEGFDVRAFWKRQTELVASWQPARYA